MIGSQAILRGACPAPLAFLLFVGTFSFSSLVCAQEASPGGKSIDQNELGAGPPPPPAHEGVGRGRTSPPCETVDKWLSIEGTGEGR